MELVVSAAALPSTTRKRATSAKIFHVLDKSPKSPMKLARRKLHPKRSSGALSERGIPLSNSYSLDDLLQGRLNLWGSG
jgi:hypothetical protein